VPRPPKSPAHAALSSLSIGWPTGVRSSSASADRRSRVWRRVSRNPNGLLAAICARGPGRTSFGNHSNTWFPTEHNRREGYMWHLEAGPDGGDEMWGTSPWISGKTRRPSSHPPLHRTMRRKSQRGAAACYSVEPRPREVIFRRYRIVFKNPKVVGARVGTAITAALPTHHPSHIGERGDLPLLHPLVKAAG
jgi:hypothetical protein